MEAAPMAEVEVEAASAVSLPALRALVGHDVVVETAGGHLGGHLLSCTARSAWIVDGDVDHVVALPLVRGIRPT